MISSRSNSRSKYLLNFKFFVYIIRPKKCSRGRTIESGRVADFHGRQEVVSSLGCELGSVLSSLNVLYIRSMKSYV